MFGGPFQQLIWQMRRELKKEKRPIVLFFGGGYDSQILLYALSKVRRKFTAVHCLGYEEPIPDKIKTVLKHFKGVLPIFLRVCYRHRKYKTWYFQNNIWLQDKQLAGFCTNDYCLVTGHEANETSLHINFIEKKMENDIFCPLIRYSDDYISMIYQDMKDDWCHGEILYENSMSDSHHPNIKIY